MPTEPLKYLGQGTWKLESSTVGLLLGGRPHPRKNEQIEVNPADLKGLVLGDGKESIHPEKAEEAQKAWIMLLKVGGKRVWTLRLFRPAQAYQFKEGAD